MRTAILALAATLAMAAGAYAQSAPDAPPPATAPQAGDAVVLEPLNSPFVIAPEYKTTRVDGRTGGLAGGYAGRMLDDEVLIGGALYTLINRPRGTDLTYGGLLVGWMSSPAHRVRFGGRTLAGVGEGELPVTVTYAGLPEPSGRSDLLRFGHGAAQAPAAIPQPETVSVRVRDSFAVIEPEAAVSARLSSHVSVDVTAGYRVTGATDALRDRLNGVTGALALQFGW